jgi:hypothetical protein
MIDNATHSMTIRKSRHIIVGISKTNHACADCGQGLSSTVHDVALLAQKSKEHGFKVALITAYEGEVLPW